MFPDGRRFAHVNPPPTLRVCTWCGATWDNEARAVEHRGQHGKPSYKRASLYPDDGPICLTTGRPGRCVCCAWRGRR